MRTTLRLLCCLALSSSIVMLAPAAISAADPSTSTAQPTFAFIYLNDVNSASSFRELLVENDLGAELVAMDDVPTTNFDPYAAVIVGPDIKKAWSTSAANRVRDTKKPVLGIGEGGSYFFEKLNLAIGWMHTWHGGDVAVRAVRSTESHFWLSSDLELPEDEELVLYAETSHVGVHLPQLVAGVVPLGQELGSRTHYPIAEQNRHYVLWGFTASPDEMTTMGKQLFVHTCRYVAMADDDLATDSEHEIEASQSSVSAAIVERLQQLEERVARLESPAVENSAIGRSNASNTSFVGDWVNIEERGPTRISIREMKGNQWSIRAWGACHPTDCDWGSTSLHLIGRNVGAKDIPYGFAIWNHGFKDRFMTLHVENDQLVVVDYNIYKDSSGRSNYRRVSRLRRETPPSEASREVTSAAADRQLPTLATPAAPIPNSAKESPVDEVASKVRPLRSANSQLGHESLAVYFTYGPVNGARTLVQTNWDGTVRSYMELPYSVSGLAADNGRLLATTGGSRVGQGRVFSIGQQGVVATVFRDKEILRDTSKIWSNVDSDEFLVVDNGADVVVAVPKDDSRSPEVRIRLVDRPNYQSNSVAKCSDGSILYSDSDEKGVFRVPVGSGPTLGEPLLAGKAAVAARPGSNTWVAALEERLHVFEGDEPVAELTYPEGMMMFRPNIDFASDGTLVLAFHAANRQYFYAVDLDKKQFTGLFTVAVSRMTSLAVAPKMDWGDAIYVPLPK